MLFFGIVYAVEGIGQAKSGIIWQPLSYFLKETRGWGPVEISAALAVLDVPWIIKPLYGLISDFLPIAGYRRRSWLLLASLAVSAAFAYVALGATAGAMIPALVMTAIAMAVMSTVCGALLVENGQRLNATGAFVNQQWLWFNAAAMAAALTGGWLAELVPGETALRLAAAIAAVAPVAVLLALTLVREDRAVIDRAGFARGVRGLLATFRSRDLWLVVGFLFCYYFSPGLGTPLYFTLTDRLGFSQHFIGVLTAITALGWIAGGLLYRYVLWRLTERRLLTLSLGLGAGSTLLYLALDGPKTAIVIWFFTGVSGMVANVATLSLAASRCPRGAEGFTFAAMMSVINLATPLSDTLGSVLFQHVFENHLSPLILVSAAFTGFVLVLVPLIKPKQAVPRDQH